MQSIELRTAIRTAIALVMTALIAFSMHLPSPYWSCMTVVIVSRQYHGELAKKGFMRIIGTFIGAAIGYGLSHYIINSFFLFILVNFFIIAIGFYGYRRSQYTYAYLLAMITVFLINAEVVIMPDNAFYIAIWRPIEISLGVIITTLCSLIILPNKGIDRLQQLINQHQQILLDITQILTTKKFTENDINTINQARELMSEAKQLLTSLSFEVSESRLALLRNSCDFQQQLMIHLVELCQLTARDYQQEDELLKRLNLSQAFSSLNQDLLIHFEQNNVEKTTLADSLKQMDKHISNLRKQNLLSNYSTTTMIQFHRIFKLLQSINVLLSQHTPYDYLAKIKRINADPDALKQSIKAGLTGVLALLIWMLSNWPSGIQGIISSLIISMQRNVEDMNIIGIQRLCGCLIGGTIALLLLKLSYFDLSTLVFSLSLFGGVFHYLFFKLKKNNYLFFQANLAFIITLVQVGGPPDSLAPPLQRLAGIVIGILCSSLVANAFWRHTKQSYTINRITKLYQLVLTNLQLSIAGQVKLHNLSPLISLIRDYFDKLPDTVKLGNYNILFEQLIQVQRLLKLNTVTINQTILASATHLNCDIKNYQNQVLHLFKHYQNKPIELLSSQARIDLSESLMKQIQSFKHHPNKKDLSSEQINELINYLASLITCLTLQPSTVST